MNRRKLFRLHLYMVSCCALMLEAPNAAIEGVTGRCDLDSVLLSRSDSLGLQFVDSPKKSVLEIERLTQSSSGVAFENRYYREALLGELGLPLINMPGVSGRAVFEGGQGGDSSWEVSCFRKDKAIWIGEQFTAGSSLDGVVWLGQDSALGWTLSEEGTRKAWIFVPGNPVSGLPGKIEGYQAEGELDIHVHGGTQLRIPGSHSVSTRRFHVRFKPKKGLHWSCGEAACKAVAFKDHENANLLKSMSKNMFIYWGDTDGWIADVSSKKGGVRTWEIQWFLSGNPISNSLNPR